jgi:hypothetical protein
MTLNQPIPAETCRNEADSIGKNVHKALRISNLGSTDENQPTTLNLFVEGSNPSGGTNKNTGL